MKHILLTLTLAFFSISAFTQEYSKVITVEGTSAERSYQLTKEWIALTYNSAQDVIQLDTPTKVIVKGKLTLPSQMAGMANNWLIDNTITIAFKDDRFKMDVEVGRFTNAAYPQMNFPLPDYYLQKVDKQTYFSEMWEDQNIRNAGPKLRATTEKKYGDQYYAQYLKDFDYYNLMINNLFTSLQAYVLENSEDDW